MALQTRMSQPENAVIIRGDGEIGNPFCVALEETVQIGRMPRLEVDPFDVVRCPLVPGRLRCRIL